jgi:hypothetical protein
MVRGSATLGCGGVLIAVIGIESIDAVIFRSDYRELQRASIRYTGLRGYERQGVNIAVDSTINQFSRSRLHIRNRQFSFVKICSRAGIGVELRQNTRLGERRHAQASRRRPLQPPKSTFSDIKLSKSSPYSTFPPAKRLPDQIVFGYLRIYRCWFLDASKIMYNDKSEACRGNC